MPDEIKINRPAVQQPVAAIASQEAKGAIKFSDSRRPWVILGVIVVALIIAGVLLRDRLFGGSRGGSLKGVATQAEKYQAVFLTNGQVYFGKLSNANDNYLTLVDIYYLQVIQPPLQGQGSSGQQQQQEPKISLVKLGNELHGPVDEMRISRAQVLFYEDLKEDGQVVKAIMTDKSGKK